MLSDQELAEILAAASLAGARVLTPGALFLGRQPLLLHYPRAFYEGSTRHELPLVSQETKKANAQLIALVPALARKVLDQRRVRAALREVMEDHAWRNELWRFTDETEAVLAALEVRDGRAG